MKLIKNVSPIKTKVNLSVYKPTGELFSFELNFGESMLVHDTSVTARPIIIQKRKGHIDIIDNYTINMIPYKINSVFERMEESKVDIIEAANIAETVDKINVNNTIVEINSQPKNKGGRPKGSFKKKGKGRPKNKKNKSKSINNITQDNETGSKES